MMYEESRAFDRKKDIFFSFWEVLVGLSGFTSLGGFLGSLTLLVDSPWASGLQPV